MSAETKVLLYCAFSAALFSITEPKTFIFVFACLLPFLLMMPSKKLFSGIIPITIFLSFTFLSNALNHPGKIIWTTGGFTLTEEGLISGEFRTSRIFLMILGAKMLMWTTTPQQMVSGLRNLMRPFERLGLPLGDFFHTMGLTAACFPVLKKRLSDSWKENSEHKEVKGFFSRAKAVAIFLFPILVEGIRHPDIFFEETGEGR